MLYHISPNGSANSESYFVYGKGLIGEQIIKGEYLVYHFDNRGSTVAITDMDGVVTDRFTYGPYGELINHDGDSHIIFLYNGRDGVVTDANGLYYMRARYYNPELKRFINADILLGSISDSSILNRYAYVSGDPVSLVDPFGLSPDINTSTIGHTILNFLGMIPGIGCVFDFANMIWYIAEGNWLEAAFCFTCIWIYCSRC